MTGFFEGKYITHIPGLSFTYSSIKPQCTVPQFDLLLYVESNYLKKQCFLSTFLIIPKVNICTRPKWQSNNQRATSIAESLFAGMNSNVGFRFWFNPSEYFQQIGFIPLSRVPSFFEKWQVVNKFYYL